jgi:hypothetical protein
MIELATGCNNARTPWSVIGEDPSKFMDPACLPIGFVFQDPSRMGIQVKNLLNHLRERQDRLGVNAFSFHHVLRNNKLEPAEYPAEVKTAMSEVTDLVKPVADDVMKVDGSGDELPTVQQMQGELQIKMPTITTVKPSIFPPQMAGPSCIPPLTPLPLPLPVPLPLPLPSHLPSGHSDYQPSVGHGTFTPNPYNFNPQYMAYWFQQMMESKSITPGWHPQNTESNQPLHGSGYHLGQAQSTSNFRIDPNLLPPGPPLFAPNDITSHFHSNVNEISVSAVDQNADKFKKTLFEVKPTQKLVSTPVKSTPKKTPKRKRSNDSVAAQVTPSRSNRNRRPSQKLKESMQADTY